MNNIAYSKTNENIFLYIDNNSQLNIMDELTNIEYNRDGQRKINASGVNISYNDDYILYNNPGDTDSLSIERYDDLLNGYLGRVRFRFETAVITDIVVSKNRNRVAIIFIPDQHYTVQINGQRERHDAPIVASMDYNYLHVYDFSDVDTTLVFEKIYNTEVIIALSDIDTIAIFSAIDINDKLFEVYDLNTGNNIISENNQRLLNFSTISCMHYISSTPHLYNFLVIITVNAHLQNHLRVINLQGNTFIEIWNNIVQNNVSCIDIARNGRIALGGINGILVYHSFGAVASTYFQDRSIDGLSLSPNALYLGIDFLIGYRELFFRPRISVLSLQQGIPGVDTIIFQYPVYDHGDEGMINYDNRDDDLHDQRERHRVIDEMDMVHRQVNAFDIDDEFHDANLVPVRYLHNFVDDDQAELSPIHRVEEPDVEIEDPQLDVVVPNQPPDQLKLKMHGSDDCLDLYSLDEENIGNYLSNDPDNIVIFYKQPSDAGFLATCCSFTRLKKYLKDPMHVFYSCIQGYDFRNYYRNPPEFLKIPTGTHTIFVNYQDMKAKYLQRQNMIFLEHQGKVQNTITYDASFNMAFVSGNHCQDGSVIDVYRIIF